MFFSGFGRQPFSESPVLFLANEVWITQTKSHVYSDAISLLILLMYVGVVELLRNLPLYGGGFVSPLIQDSDSQRDVLTGQSTVMSVNLRPRLPTVHGLYRFLTVLLINTPRPNTKKHPCDI